MDIEVLKIIFNGMTFGQRKAEKIVGSRDAFSTSLGKGLSVARNGTTRGTENGSATRGIA